MSELLAYDLTTLEGFRQAMNASRTSDGVKGIHCPTCGAQRRVDPHIVFTRGSHLYSEDDPDSLDCSVVQLNCRECHTVATTLLYPGPSGTDLVILWSHLGGLRTPHTPDGVAYYLDQAARAESVGARSAAIAMYRAAIEQLLLEQGYTARMLGPKVGQLNTAITAGTAPRWAADLAPEFMSVLGKLGNAAIHAGDGDVTKQAELDTGLLADVRIVLERLLESVYERPLHDAALLARLKSKADKVK